jgi:hypothetical protein
MLAVVVQPSRRSLSATAARHYNHRYRILSPQLKFSVNIVILHCHFERGGVSQVVENHVRALKNIGDIQRIFLASGDRIGGLSAETLAAVTTVTVNDFDYDSQMYSAEALANRAASIAENLSKALLSQGVDRESTVLHWHNHSLGKNSAAPAVIRLLAQTGWRLLLQIHDFAEDNRPGNYQHLISASGAKDKTDIDRYLYPVASQIHYATLTRADQSAVLQIGIPTARAHWLPNSVAAPSEDRSSQAESLLKIRSALGLPSDARWYLYPVRGIRRKNVGEFLLLSRWTDPSCYSGLTLRPATPIEERSYDRWRKLAEDVAPRAIFDAAREGIPFADNVAAADAILSTSVAEGFGMTFLEPWLSGREVIARRLQTVTDDFEESGIRIDKLYDQIPVPGDKQWLLECQTQYSEALNAAWEKIPTEFRPQESKIDGHLTEIDFALLTTDRQTEVLRRISQDPGFEAELQDRSSSLIMNLRSGPDRHRIKHNESIVRDRYSTEHAAITLRQIYQMIAAAPIDNRIDAPAGAGSGVDTINDVRPFYPCRTELI